MRTIITILLALITISLEGCAPKLQDGVFIIVSKVDCINCRKPIPALADIALKSEHPLVLINPNCRELEMKGLAKDFGVSIEEVTCFGHISKELFQSYMDNNETYVVIIRDQQVVFESPVRNVDIKAFTMVMNN